MTQQPRKRSYLVHVLDISRLVAQPPARPDLAPDPFPPPITFAKKTNPTPGSRDNTMGVVEGGTCSVIDHPLARRDFKPLPWPRKRKR